MFDDGARATNTSPVAPAPFTRPDRSFLPETMWISAGISVSSIASQIGSHDGSPNGSTPGIVPGALGSEMTLMPRSATRRSSAADASGSNSGRMAAPRSRSGSAPCHTSTSQSLYARNSAFEYSLSSSSMNVRPARPGSVGKQVWRSTPSMSMSAMRSFGS